MKNQYPLIITSHEYNQYSLMITSHEISIPTRIIEDIVFNIEDNVLNKTNYIYNIIQYTLH